MKWPAKDIQRLLGLSDEEWRRFRKGLPTLTRRDGRREGYGSADVIAMLIVAEVGNRLGTTASSLAFAAAALWKTCARLDWTKPDPSETMLILIDSEGQADVRFNRGLDRLPSAPMVVAIALAPLMERMMDMARELFPEELPQGELF